MCCAVLLLCAGFVAVLLLMLLLWTKVRASVISGRKVGGVLCERADDATRARSFSVPT
jgi:hypothetical protein